MAVQIWRKGATANYIYRESTDGYIVATLGEVVTNPNMALYTLFGTPKNFEDTLTTTLYTAGNKLSLYTEAIAQGYTDDDARKISGYEGA